MGIILPTSELSPLVSSCTTTTSVITWAETTLPEMPFRGREARMFAGLCLMLRVPDGWLLPVQPLMSCLGPGRCLCPCSAFPRVAAVSACCRDHLPRSVCPIAGFTQLQWTLKNRTTGNYLTSVCYSKHFKRRPAERPFHAFENPKRSLRLRDYFNFFQIQAITTPTLISHLKVRLQIQSPCYSLLTNKLQGHHHSEK